MKIRDDVMSSKDETCILQSHNFFLVSILKCLMVSAILIALIIFSSLIKIKLAQRRKQNVIYKIICRIIVDPDMVCKLSKHFKAFIMSYDFMLSWLYCAQIFLKFCLRLIFQWYG